MQRRQMLAIAAGVGLASIVSAHAEKMQVGFLWHMHQPIYYPGESIIQTDNSGRYSYSVKDIHNQRFGPYTTWPRDAIQSGLGLPNLGASVSFSGSLMQNLNDMQAAGVNGGMWNNWQGAYTQARGWNTSEGNPRLDMIGFNWAHALMPLLDIRDMRMQIQLHKQAVANTFGASVPYSKGFFPAETAFSERMIPALKAEGIDWTLVDNIHFDRATKNYPQTNSSGLFAPNKADQINPDPAANGGAWVQLNNVWAPSKVSAPFSYRPHNVQYVDPNTGTATQMVAVPAARYEGNEDGRGGFGALQYQSVMDQYRQYNTDPAHPLLVVLHHDGDNYGGGSDSYYHSNFQNMVNWANGNANYNVSTVSDYLKRFPVASNDLIHVENGSWAGADNGDAEFKKWLGDPSTTGWSPDRNSWAVLTAAKNRVFTAEDIQPITSHNNILNNGGNNTDKAWHYLVQAEASDHWYWDGTEVWDSNVTRGSNLAVQKADQVIASFSGTEHTPPTVFVPQRDSYNPGEYEFASTREPSDFKVWTYAYDVSGLQSVSLKFRTDNDGENPLSSSQNETYAGGSEVGAWSSLPMSSSDVLPPSNILSPQYRALQYAAQITGISGKLVDYDVEAVDQNGNVTKSDIQHVWVGNATGGGGGGGGSTGTAKTAFNMDGVLDAEAPEVASNGGMKLNVTMRNGKLYVATNDAGEGNDHFIFIAKQPGALVAAPWAKAGQVAQWDAFLADENDNTYSGWFDNAGTVTNATGTNGGVLEGTIDVAGEFGSIPTDLYFAVGLFGNANGGTLLSAYGIPISADGDGNINANEYVKVTLPQGWQQTGSGSWNVGFNWAEGVPNGIGVTAKFLNMGTVMTNVTVDSNVTVGQMIFNSPTTYTISGAASINLDVASGNASVTVNQGNHLIAANMTMSDNTIVNVATGASLGIGTTLTLANGSTFTKSGGGSVDLNAPVVASANSKFQVTAGLLNVHHDLNGAALEVNGGSATLDANQHLSSLTIAAGGKVTLNDALGTRVVKTSAINIAGQFEMADNSMIIDHNGISPAAALRGALLAGFNNGSWNGNGITSIPASTRTDRAFGYAEASAIGAPATFFNETIDNTSLLMRYTISGDTNLDGKVNTVDFNNLAGAFGGANQYWFTGDFNYDGQVSSTDFNTLAQNYGSFMVFAAPAPSPTTSPNLGAIVPEPTMLGWFALGALGLRRRK